VGAEFDQARNALAEAMAEAARLAGELADALPRILI
jgi:hypothetical protein